METLNEFRTPKCVGNPQGGFWAQLEEVSSSLRWLDIAVLLLILGFGAMQFYFVARAKDFSNDDVFWADSGRSLIAHGFYGINGYRETNMPPGLPAILGFLCVAGGCSHTIFLRAMVVFGTLGFLVSYEWLRRQVPRVVAAAICLLLISSRIHFELVTQWIFPSYPYFFTSMGALLVAGRIENATRPAVRIGWGIILTALITASLILASSAIAFLGGIVAIICVTFFQDRRLAFIRLKTWVAVLIVGIAVQGLWMNHQQGEASAGIAASEWPLPGFPQSYVSQLKVKSGNDPELGMATPADFLLRVVKSTYQHAYWLSQTLLGRSVYITSMSILVLGPLLLIVLGWCYSVWRTRGAGLQEWYFAGYEFIYIVWPWTLETRFLLPVAALACLYLWRGAEALFALAKDRPRLLGGLLLPLSVLLTAGNWLWMHGAGIVGHMPHAGLQDEMSFVGWLACAIFAAWLIWGTPLMNSASTFLRRYAGWIGAVRIDLMRVCHFLGIVVVASVILLGLRSQFKVGLSNLDLNSPTNRLSADAQAAAWIGSHTDPNAVIMARHVPTALHYSGRRVVWFPPSSNPQLLMAGIQKHGIDFVVVVRRKDSYYLPADDDCFAPLLAAYPDDFRPVVQNSEFRVFQVTKKAASASRLALGFVAR
jgi:hypothetical protein